MSGATQVDINAGPLKLEYDDVHQMRSRQMEGILVTPRDLSQSIEPPGGAYGSQSFRYKGYPDKSFEKARHPVLNSEYQPERLYDDFTDPKYKKTHQFDIGTSKAFGPHRKAFAYGSDKIPSTEIKAKPIQGALMDKSNTIGSESSSAQIRRFNENKSIAEQEIQSFKEARNRELVGHRSEQQQDMERLKNYDPWGRPGGGAPLGRGQDYKKKLFTETDVTKKTGFTPVPNAKTQEIYGDFNSGFGRPGAGAVLRTNSGNIKTELKSDADIRFQTTNTGKGIIDVEARYKPKDPSQHMVYAKNLENQIQERHYREQQERKQQLEQELDMFNHDPYGRPGAGAPNASKSGWAFNQKFGKSWGWAIPLAWAETRPDMDDEEGEYMRFGKGFGNPNYTETGDVKGSVRAEHHRGGVHTIITPRPMMDDDVGLGLDLEHTRGGGGAPIKGANGRNVTRMPITMKRNEHGDSTIREYNRPQIPLHDEEEPQVYFPYGKQGGGAPLLGADGSVKTSSFGNFENKETFIKAHDARKKFMSEDFGLESQHDIDRARTQRMSHDYRLKHGGGELATQMKKLHRGQLPIDPNTGRMAPSHLRTTEVTRERVNAKGPVVNTREIQEYRTELQQEAEFRNRKRELEKRKDQQEAKRHADSMGHFWGRPGGGAPKDDNRKLNLDAIIQSPRIKSSRTNRDPYYDDDSYRPSVSEPFGPGQKDYKPKHKDIPAAYSNYLKNTSGSSASNGYQVEPVGRKEMYAQQQQRNWHQPPPFAVQNNYSD